MRVVSSLAGNLPFLGNPSIAYNGVPLPPALWGRMRIRSGHELQIIVDGLSRRPAGEAGRNQEDSGGSMMQSDEALGGSGSGFGKHTVWFSDGPPGGGNEHGFSS